MTGFSQKHVSRAGGGPCFPPRLGDGWHWTPPPPDQCTWCLIQWQNLPKARPAQSLRRRRFGVAAVRKLSPPLWGRREGAVSSAQESHGMPVPDCHAPSGLLGVCFLGGSLCSSLNPLGNSLGVFPASRYLRCPSQALPAVQVLGGCRSRRLGAG